MLRHFTRIPGARRLLMRIPGIPVPVRAEYDLWTGRPGYGYGVYRAAHLASALGLSRITVMEWGVVTGNGLVGLERLADAVAAHFDMEIDVAGFDVGGGLPPPIDYRDGAHIWGEGFYRVDEASVRSRLTRAELIMGRPIGDNIVSFLARRELAPVGFVAVNLDYYSLALEALTALAAASDAARLPRILMLFDDLLFPERACHNDWIGERRAIIEFNEGHSMQKVAQVPGLHWMRRHPAFWNEMVHVLHDFDHPLYTKLITPEGDRHRQM
jgi:hypothetical protein